MRRALGAFAAMAVAGCILFPVGVDLRLEADGTVACNLMGVHGCAPLLVIESARAEANRQPTELDPMFMTGGPVDGAQPVLGSVRHAPATIMPGDYRLVGWIAEVNDMVAPAGETMNPWVSANRACTKDLVVPERTIRVDILVHYDASGSCEIEVAVTR